MSSPSATEAAAATAAAASNSSTESLNGLKFGQKIYFEDVGVGGAVKSSGGASSSSSSGVTPPKKGRGSGAQGAQPPRCQVEGCKVDLSDAKAYYSRHKVCSMHSKSPRVVVAGQEQRFCQQCSRSPLFSSSLLRFPFPPPFLLFSLFLLSIQQTLLYLSLFVFKRPFRFILITVYRYCFTVISLLVECACSLPYIIVIFPFSPPSYSGFWYRYFN